MSLARSAARRRRFGAVLALLLAGVPLTRRAAEPTHYAPGSGSVVEWPTADGFGGSHRSPLSEITPDNVRSLEVAWSYRTGDVHEPGDGDGMAGTAFEATPVMADGRLFVATPYSRAVALDAESGRELWTFDPGIDRTTTWGQMITSRGLAHWRDPLREGEGRCAGRIFLASFDARLFSLDAATGRPCSDFGDHGVVDLAYGVARIQGQRLQYMQTAPPVPVGDVVVVGSRISDGIAADAPSGAVRGFDARTGALRWSWEPLVGIGARLPTGDSVAAGAANTWATITADPERDLIFVPTGSPSPDHYGGLRPGDNRFANSLVALRASTGELVWHYQIVHHDLWDYDLPSPPALITLRRRGEEIPAVVQGTKMGLVFVFHRETGEPLFPITERRVPPSDVAGEDAAPTQPVPSFPPPLVPWGLSPDDAWGLTPWDRAACRDRIESLRSEGIFTPPSVRGTVTYPGFVGGMEWGGVAFDPRSGLLVTNTNRLATVARLIPRGEESSPAPSKSQYAPQAKTPYGVRREALLSPLGIPCNAPPWGMLHAIDLSTGSIAWEVPLGTLRDLTVVPTPSAWGSPNLGGPLVTGGIVFIGASMDRRLRAFELTTGELVWSTKLPASIQSSPMTYRARPGGRQYLVVTAGGHAGLGSELGDYIVAFALPDAPDGAEARR